MPHCSMPKATGVRAMPIKIDIEVLVAFAGSMALTSLVVGFFVIRPLAGRGVRSMVVGSHACFVVATGAMLWPDHLPHVLAAALTIGGLYFGVALGFFATMRQAEARTRAVTFTAVGLMMVAAQAVIATGDVSVRGLMMTSSFTNPPLFLAMGILVWKATRQLGSGVALFVAAPFLALGLAYLARLAGLLLVPGNGMYEIATALIIVMIAGTAFGWARGMSAIQEARHSRLAAQARSAAETASLAKSNFLRSMSHELRTPLNAVIGLSQLMERESLGKMPPPYRPHVRNILTSGRHLLSLIEDLLDLSAIEAGEMTLAEEEVRVEELVRTVRALLDERARQTKVALEVEPPDTPLVVRGDRRRLTQILLNLCSNAVKYSPAGARVTLAWGRDETGAPALSVHDTGPGMTEAEIEEALRLFGRVARPGQDMVEGTGIGLPLARDLAEAHGGRLEMRSAPGQGTVAEVTFPSDRWVERPVSEPAPGAVAGQSPEPLKIASGATG